MRFSFWNEQDGIKLLSSEAKGVGKDGANRPSCKFGICPLSLVDLRLTLRLTLDNRMGPLKHSMELLRVSESGIP